MGTRGAARAMRIALSVPPPIGDESNMRWPSSVTAVVLSALLAASAGAMNIEVQGAAIFASGPVVDDTLRFEHALATPGVDTVVFVNSPGGDLWTGLRVGRLIAERGLRTVTAGQCVSACSIMFMGGR